MDQAKAFLTVAGTHRLGALFCVALACGLRLGEATGLRWEDVDLTTGELRVRQQLQKVGKRLVAAGAEDGEEPADARAPEVCLEALKAHRTRQLEERLKAGADWTDTGLVFTTYANRGAGRKVGTRGLHPRNVLRILHACSSRGAAAGRASTTCGTRAASLLIAAGVELVEVRCCSATPSCASPPTCTPPAEADRGEGGATHGRTLSATRRSSNLMAVFNAELDTLVNEVWS